ncbi:MAG: class I SAM-dependent methyltransferase, partial [Helicobacter sp.]|nr:class I SAM-dependent methyltransferase [Helicobacter sp.]
GGSIQITISRDLQKAKTQRFLKLLEEENIFLTDKERIFEKFQEDLATFGVEVRKLGLEIKKRQGKLLVYGASVGGVMMVYHLGLSDIIDGFLDDNVAKIGKFSPHLGIEVFNSEILEEKQEITEVLNVAWRFIEPIMQRHQEFLQRGGKFYNLELPQLQIKEYQSLLKECK